MSGMCCWLKSRQRVRVSPDDVGIEDFSCVANSLSRNITVDEFETYCIKHYEECRRYQKIEKMMKLAEKMDRVGNFFRRK